MKTYSACGSIGVVGGSSTFLGCIQIAFKYMLFNGKYKELTFSRRENCFRLCSSINDRTTSNICIERNTITFTKEKMRKYTVNQSTDIDKDLSFIKAIALLYNYAVNMIYIPGQELYTISRLDNKLIFKYGHKQIVIKENEKRYFQ
jgi:hypothetical protein